MTAVAGRDDKLSVRELVVLGTASQVPTRTRNHNGYLLRWGAESILFDPGEGTQRQFTLAGVAPSTVTHICITHFHGDHCLGLPGMLQRLSLDGVPGPVDVHFPAAGRAHFDHLRRAVAYDERVEIRPRPAEAGRVLEPPPFTLSARPLRHRVPTLGWRVEEPDGVTVLPDRLAERGVDGPDVGRLKEQGEIEVDGRRVRLEEVSVPRRGQVFAFVMDTAYCDAAVDLARGADLLVCEATYLEADAGLAAEYGHLTARAAARVAREAGAGTLVLTHFSQRYSDPAAFLDEAREVFDDVVLAEDLARIPMPRRERPFESAS